MGAQYDGRVTLIWAWKITQVRIELAPVGRTAYPFLSTVSHL